MQEIDLGRLSLPELIEIMHRTADEIESRCMVLEGKNEDGAMVDAAAGGDQWGSVRDHAGGGGDR